MKIGFLQVIDKDYNNYRTAIFIDKIIMVEEISGGTRIVMTDGSSVLSETNYEKIIEMINNFVGDKKDEL